MSYLNTFRAVLSGIPTGKAITIDSVRAEFEAAQIPPAAYGPIFAEACQKGYLEATAATVKTRWRPGRGRLVRVYRVTSKARDEIRAEAA